MLAMADHKLRHHISPLGNDQHFFVLFFLLIVGGVQKAATKGN